MNIFWSFFLLGFTFGAGPCLASCGPLLVSYTLGRGKNVLAGILAYLLFSLSRMLVYLGLGIAVFFCGHLITSQLLGVFSRYFFIAGGIFVIFLGFLISLGRNVKHSFCHWLQDFFLKKDAKTVILLGLFIGILPCAPLISVLSYIGLIAKSWKDALGFSLLFAVGTAFSPLALLVAAGGLAAGKLQRFFNLAGAAVIIYLGIQLIRKGLYAAPLY
jgi:sulfite exporter TauE/SafE